MEEPARKAGRASVLVVEDDAKTLDTLALYLRHAGHKVTTARDGAEGLRLSLTGSFDIVMLDRMLPGVDGLEICRRLRAAMDVPTLMITAMVGEAERLEGFAAGVDDYVIKPFSPREVMARVQAVLRRSRARPRAARAALLIGDVAIDPSTREVVVGDRPVRLSPTEFRLLHALAGAPTRVFSRDELAERALRTSGQADPRTVDAHVKNLRRKLDAGRPGESLIGTVLGLGYRFADGGRRRA